MLIRDLLSADVTRDFPPVVCRSIGPRSPLTRKALSLVAVLLLMLPGVPPAASPALSDWGEVAREAKWVAAGVIARTTDEGFFFASAEPFLGTPPAEQYIPQRINRSAGKLRIIAWRTNAGLFHWRSRQGNPAYSDSEWIGQVGATVRAFRRYWSASSPDERAAILREIAASGHSDALFAVRTHWRKNRDFLDFHGLLPVLIQTIRTTPSESAAEHASAILFGEARPEDLPALLTILDRPDLAFQTRVLGRIERMASPKPPPVDESGNSTDPRSLIQARRAWFEEHQHELAWRGRRQQRQPQPADAGPPP